MHRRAFLFTTAIAGLIVPFAGTMRSVFADTLGEIQKRGKLLVAIDLGSPPFGTTDGQMRPTGSDVESAKLLAADLGVPMEIVQVTSPNRVPFLLTGKADIVMASFSVSEERKKVIDFSDAYGVIQIVVAAAKGVQIKSVDDLAGKRIGTTRGSTNDKEVTTQVKAADIVRYDDDATLITALVSGQIEILASSPQVMAAVNARLPNDLFEVKVVLKTNPYAIGLRKGEDALRIKLNEWIAKRLADGTLNTIYLKYNGVALPAEMPKA